MTTETELLREAVALLKASEEFAIKTDVQIDGEWGSCRTAAQLEAAKELSDIVYEIRAFLAKIDAMPAGEVPLPLSALVCVGRARFPRTGGNAGISWHVEDALSDTGGFRSGNPCNGELLFVLPATAKRAMLAAARRQDGAR